jgi:hypothetical protein
MCGSIRDGGVRVMAKPAGIINRSTSSIRLKPGDGAIVVRADGSVQFWLPKSKSPNVDAGSVAMKIAILAWILSDDTRLYEELETQFLKWTGRKKHVEH